MLTFRLGYSIIIYGQSERDKKISSTSYAEVSELADEQD